ncbi:hypothetical protein Tco_0339565 [Tanacetum coccineum]
MQGGRGRGDPFFGMGGDPFAGFGAESIWPYGKFVIGWKPIWGPFMGGGLFGNARSPFMRGSPFGSSLLGPSGIPFMDAHESRGYEHMQSMPNTSRGRVIEELNSDNENDEQQAGHRMDDGRSARQPYVE